MPSPAALVSPIIHSPRLDSSMRNAPRPNPLGDDLLLLHQARKLWMEGKREQSLARFSDAVAQHPLSVRALIEAARVCGQAHEISKAEGYLADAIELAGDSPQQAPLIAQSYRMMHRPEKAIAAFRAIIGQNLSDSSDNFFELAVHYVRSSHTDEWGLAGGAL